MSDSYPLSSVDRYLAPTTLVQALAALADRGGAIVLAGGTDLMPQSRAGRVRAAPTLLNIRRVAGLDALALDGDTLRLGALTTVATLRRHPLVRAHAGLLAEAADHFASDQIRHAATLGGNVCNASPAGDLLTPLLALDAEVELARLADDGSIRGTRASTRAARARRSTSPRSRSPSWPARMAQAGCAACGWRWARWRRRRCARGAPRRCSKAPCSTPRPRPRPPPAPPPRRRRSTTCAPAPGTAASWCAT